MLRRTQWKNKGNWKGFKPVTEIKLKRTPLAKISQSETPTLKRDIQDLIRKIVIIRDGGCILRHYPEAGSCGGYAPKAGHLILQAEHLVTRARSNYFGDLRNIVCLCKRHHGTFKPQFSFLYWRLIEKHLGATGWAWFKRAEADNKTYQVDWKIIKIELQNKLKKYEIVKSV